jgi:hypothetical protein
METDNSMIPFSFSLWQIVPFPAPEGPEMMNNNPLLIVDPFQTLIVL